MALPLDPTLKIGMQTIHRQPDNQTGPWHPTVEQLVTFVQAIDKAGLTDVYIEAVLEQISPSYELVVVEGFMTDAQARRFSERLGGRAFIWDVHRATGPSED